MSEMQSWYTIYIEQPTHLTEVNTVLGTYNYGVSEADLINRQKRNSNETKRRPCVCHKNIRWRGGLSGSTPYQPWHYIKVDGYLHAPAALPPRKARPVARGRDTGWVSEPVWTLWRKHKSLAPAENRTIPRFSCLYPRCSICHMNTLLVNSTICTSQQVLFGQSNKEWDGRGMWHVWGREKVGTGIWR